MDGDAPGIKLGHVMWLVKVRNAGSFSIKIECKSSYYRIFFKRFS